MHHMGHITSTILIPSEVRNMVIFHPHLSDN